MSGLGTGRGFRQRGSCSAVVAWAARVQRVEECELIMSASRDPIGVEDVVRAVRSSFWSSEALREVAEVIDAERVRRDAWEAGGVARLEAEVERLAARVAQLEA